MPVMPSWPQCRSALLPPSEDSSHRVSWRWVFPSVTSTPPLVISTLCAPVGSTAIRGSTLDAHAFARTAISFASGESEVVLPERLRLEDRFDHIQLVDAAQLAGHLFRPHSFQPG